MGTNSRKEKSEVCLDLDRPSHGSTYGNENTPLAPSESRSQKSADGRMATGAGLAEWEQTHGKKKAKCVLTSTGLLMEGLCGQRTRICLVWVTGPGTLILSSSGARK